MDTGRTGNRARGGGGARGNVVAFTAKGPRRTMFYRGVPMGTRQHGRKPRSKNQKTRGRARGGSIGTQKKRSQTAGQGQGTETKGAGGRGGRKGFGAGAGFGETFCGKGPEHGDGEGWWKAAFVRGQSGGRVPQNMGKGGPPPPPPGAGPTFWEISGGTNRNHGKGHPGGPHSAGGGNNLKRENWATGARGFPRRG